MSEQNDIDPWLLRSRFDLNDLGNSQRFEAQSAGRLLWSEELDEWMHFDDRRWSVKDGDGHALACAHDVVRSMRHEIHALINADGEALRAVYGAKFDDDKRQKRIAALLAHKEKTGDARGCKAMIAQAKGLQSSNSGAFTMRARLDEFDTDPLALHCLNGTVRFVRGDDGQWQVRFSEGHDPRDRFMQLAAVEYDPTVNCPGWQARLEELHNPPEVERLRRIYGTCLTGRSSEQKLFIFLGGGNDGKSMTNDVFGSMLGDYFLEAKVQSILKGKEKSGSDHDSDIMAWKGDYRMVLFPEPPKRSTFDATRVKIVTGSNVTGRDAYGRKVETFRPRLTPIMECNNLPASPSDDRGMVRRLDITPWKKTYGITPGLVDRNYVEVRDELLAETSGILNWAIQGCLDWLAGGKIAQSELVALASENYWQNESHFLAWLEAYADLSDPTHTEEATILYQHFTNYLQSEANLDDETIKKNYSQTKFGKALGDRLIYADKDSRTGRKVRIGIKLKRSGDLAEAASAGADDAPDYADWDEGFSL